MKSDTIQLQDQRISSLQTDLSDPFRHLLGNRSAEITSHTWAIQKAAETSIWTKDRMTIQTAKPHGNPRNNNAIGLQPVLYIPDSAMAPFKNISMK